MNKRAPALHLICITLATCAWVARPTAAQQIVKWTDEQGQIHFSDHAPPGQKASPVVVQKAPPSALPPTAVGSGVVGSRSQVNSAVSGPGDSEAGRRAAAFQAQQRRWNEQNKAAAAARLKADKDLIAQCKANRETYCNQSADGIRKQEHTIAEMQYLDAVTHRQELSDRGISTPAPQPPPPLNNASN